jgi:hypothetical protein
MTTPAKSEFTVIHVKRYVKWPSTALAMPLCVCSSAFFRITSRIPGKEMCVENESLQNDVRS